MKRRERRTVISAQLREYFCKYAARPRDFLSPLTLTDGPVGNRLDLSGIRAYAVFAKDAPKKWYFSSSEYTLFEIGIQLMLPHRCKNLTNVCSMNLYVRLSAPIS